MAAARSLARLIPRLLPAFPAILALAALSGCGSDNPTCVCGTGRIYGTIGTVGPRPPAMITAHGVDSGSDINADMDSTGSYDILVPPGAYNVTLDLADDYLVLTDNGFATYGIDPVPRKISVGRDESVRIDADFGAAAVILATSPEMEGMPIDVRLMGPLWFAYAYDTVTAGHASFRFPIVVPGDYTLGVHIDSSHYFYLPGTYRPSEAQAFRVDAGSEATIEGSLPAPGWISGTITGAWQEESPWLRPHIGLAAEPDSIIIAGSDVAADGSFTLPVFAPIRGRISVQIWSTRWYGGGSFATATPVEGSPGQTTHIDLLDSAIALRFDGNSSYLHLYDASRRPLFEDATLFSPGVVGFPNLPPSTYYLKLDGKEGSWIGQWFDQTDSANATPIVVEEGQLHTIDFHLSTGGRIEGRILAGDGTPVFVAGVYLFRSSREIAYQTTAQDGTYSLTGFGDGDYKVSASYLGRSRWYPGVADSADATPIAIRGMNTVSGVDIQFPE